MGKFVQTQEGIVKASLVELCTGLATSKVGAALLDAQMTDLEKRCAVIHHRIGLRRYLAALKKKKGHGIDRHTKRDPLFGTA